LRPSRLCGEISSEQILLNVFKTWCVFYFVNARSNVLTKEESLAEIVERAQSGCRDAFDDLIVRFEGKVLKTALYLIRNMEDAQDIAQEVYVKIFRSIQACKDIDRIEHWVYRITVNAARDFQRRKRFYLPLAMIVKGSIPHDPVLRDEIRNRLTEALALLSFNERTAFIFKALEEMETAEVAEILGCRVVTVRSHLHSARKKLQKHFRDFGEALWTN
jgi:RNA polymerase sigma-70 factor, ECF subfamily